MYLLALDPGSVNFGYAILRFARKQIHVERCGMLTKLVKALNGEDVVHPALTAHQKQLKTLVDSVGCFHIAAERYTTRVRGTTCEAVNQELGVAGLLLPITLYMSAQWKNHYNKQFDIKAYYKECKVPPHVVDATLIGCYYLQREHDGKFTTTRLAKQIQTTCRIPKKR